MGDDIKKPEEGYGDSEHAPRTSKPIVNLAPATYPKAGRPFAPKNVFSLFIGLIWLGPAIALLVLNFKGHIIGAGIGCDGLECRIDPYSTNQVQQVQALDEKNHDILGALQLVAKALEIWFMFVAGNLVYNVALRLAKKNLLPLSLLTTYAEFLDILYLKSLMTILINIAREKRKGVATSIPSVPAPSSIIMPNRPENIATVINTATVEDEAAESSTPPKDTKRQHFILYCFIALVAFLSIVANLMGTSTAILVLPTLNWIDINQNDDIAFLGPKSSEPPGAEIISPGCSVEELTQGLYSCSSSMYAATLDDFMDMAVSSRNQDISRKANAIPPLIHEGNVTATLNISETSRTIWVPTRQTMREFSTDLNNYYFTTTFSLNNANDPRYPDSVRFNQALQARLQRKGPIIGMGNDCIRDTLVVNRIDDNKEVICFPRAEDTKCIRWGSGWSDTTQTFARFVIADAFPPEDQPADLTVSVWETDRATYLSHDDFQRCNTGECDWEALLSAPPAPENINISGSSLTFEYSLPNDAADMQILCHTAFYLSFANYVLNPSPLSNILSLIELNVLNDSPSAPPDNDTSPILSIHPDWLLLAWSVNRTDGVIPGSRSSNTQFLRAAQTWLGGQDDSPNEEDGNRRYARTFNSLHQYSIVQALSMIPYDTSTLTAPSARNTHEQALKAHSRTTATLSSYASVQLWKYGLDSRTAKLGVTIMIIGCLCVIARLIIYYDESKSPTEIVVTALEHPTPGTTVNKATGAPLRVSYLKHNRTLSFGTPGSAPASPV